MNTSDPDSVEEFFAGVDLDAVPSWTTAEDLAEISIAAFHRAHGTNPEESK